MGRRGRGSSRTQRKHFKQTRENVWKRSKSDPQPDTRDDSNANTNDKNDAWRPLPTENAAFEEYYKEQGIVPPQEWDTFLEFLRKPLPAAFRINSSGQFALDIRLQLENDFVKSLQDEVTEGDEAEAIRPLPWYPDNLAWHANFSRNQLRKNQTLERFHEFLKLANEIGNITRQEAVSMVPPLFLDVHPDHFVLDMCAAPGSKTFQLLEIVNQSNKPGTLPNAMVVANDVDVQRSNLLIHQTKRMCTANLVVTNHEAQNFPGCNLRKHHYKVAESRTAEGLTLNQLLFDRVLCDVPCSGDGTLRKAPDMWRKWNCGMGNGLHSLQLQIAMRGLSLLKVGGRMVYSTCSMNPVENEAVVAEILRRCKDSVELVDVSGELPQLVRRPGLKKWKVRDKGRWLASHNDARKIQKVGVVPSMFPSGRTNLNFADQSDDHDQDLCDTSETSSKAKSENGSPPTTEETFVFSADEEISSFPLERCMRIVPHDQNTGAFFIAIFQKHSPIPVDEQRADRLPGVNEPMSCEVFGAEGKQDGVAVAVSTEATDGEYREETTMEDSNAQELPKTDVDAKKPAGNNLTDEPCQTTEGNGSQDKLEKEHKINGSEMAGAKRKLQMQGRWKGVDPVLFFKNETVINLIKSFYGIADSFPLNGHLICRNTDNDRVKRIYYISKSVKDVLELNLLVGQQLKIASVGLKMFERQTSKEGHASPCLFRISSEGLPLILPYVTKQILYASALDFKHLLQYKTIKFGDFVDAEFGEKASQLMMGCCVVVLREDGQSTSDPIELTYSTLAIGCWKGRTNIAVMVAANECRDLLERFVARMEAKGISLPEKVKSSNLVANYKEDLPDETTVEPSEAVKIR